MVGLIRYAYCVFRFWPDADGPKKLNYNKKSTYIPTIFSELNEYLILLPKIVPLFLIIVFLEFEAMSSVFSPTVD